MSTPNEEEEREPIAHHNVVVLSTGNADEMDALISMPSLRGLIWRRLDDTYALVDPTAINLIHERLASVNISVTVGELPMAGE